MDGRKELGLGLVVDPMLTVPSSLPVSPHDDQASNLIMGAMSRGNQNLSPSPTPAEPRRNSGLSMFGFNPPRSPDVKVIPSKPIGGSRPVGDSNSDKRAPRPPSPFFRARRSRDQARARDRSPEVKALRKDTEESDGESVGAPRRYRPQASAYEDGDDSGTEVESDEEVEPDILDDDEDFTFDEETEKNTEANAVFLEGDAAGLGEEASKDNDSVLDTFGEEVEQDPLGEGPNVVVPSQPVFAVPQDQLKRRKSVKSGLEISTSRPSFARDRCTINITQGDPDGALEESNKRLRRYVVLSDLSDESGYAVEWSIGTVARDGDEIFLISVKEDESKVDPKNWSNADKAQKLKNQREVGTTFDVADFSAKRLRCCWFAKSRVSCNGRG